LTRKDRGSSQGTLLQLCSLEEVGRIPMRTTFYQALQKCAAPAISGMVLGSLIASLLLDIFMLPHSLPRDAAGTLTRTLVFFYSSLLVAVPITLLYGWTIYSFCLYKGWNLLLPTIALPLLPALLVYPYAETVGGIVLLYGLCIALVGHIAQKRTNKC
jgi:hypothetical protein